MEIQYVYQKKRSEFGRQCMFSDKGPDLIDNYPSSKDFIGEYILRDPVSQGTQCAPIQAEHSLNTMRAEYVNSAMNHTEGGWPKDVNIHDEEQTKRYRRKVEKDEGFNHTIIQLCKNMENCILQNNAINIYQQYFSDVEPTPLVERSSARTVNVYQDQCPVTRPITHISWSPDLGTKLAVTHCNLQFQAVVPNEATHSYIWEVENPNRPLLVLKPSIPCLCLEYNQKDSHSLVSGQFNGQVAVWDTRRGSEPVELSTVEVGHRDPVHNVLWINSKSGTEFFSSSTDGQVKWWDTRKLNSPLETLILSAPGQIIEKAMGASCLEYESTIPTRFMVGTEHGVVISCNRKGKSPSEKMALRFNAHLGPVLGLQRNPAFVKNFLTVGDWTARIWSEDCRESSIMWTSYHRSMLTDCAWSPTRFSVFFTTRADGILDVWDVLQQQKQACLGVKVSDDPLKSLRTHDMGRLVAVGNQKGYTYLVQFSENLSTSNKNDKMLLTADILKLIGTPIQWMAGLWSVFETAVKNMFERESRREKILEARNRELRLKLKAKSAQQVATDSEMEMLEKEKKEPSSTSFMDPQVAAAEAEFFNVIKIETFGPEPEVDEEEMHEQELEPEPEPEPPKPPPTEPKKKGKEGKKKK